MGCAGQSTNCNCNCASIISLRCKGFDYLHVFILLGVLGYWICRSGDCYIQRRITFAAGSTTGLPGTFPGANPESDPFFEIKEPSLQKHPKTSSSIILRRHPSTSNPPAAARAYIVVTCSYCALSFQSNATCAYISQPVHPSSPISSQYFFVTESGFGVA